MNQKMIKKGEDLLYLLLGATVLSLIIMGLSSGAAYLFTIPMFGICIGLFTAVFFSFKKMANCDQPEMEAAWETILNKLP
ncbi:hypothetical protein A2331_05500 [Candidatus Falkowbacteria bacterium RIFOXYB2_FULL_34_18]|uniref:Uncharacterized protein n=1 Tax=Candidatus Falkowbacteria bacterium RIFOXYD2_FULL_34_120 TaxID=1798007 RepID=A0A1F5TQZ1_9BACT|nr:MAG: hypothetical protein A2331_05500 [Candidatus Falkowbacteria bacterium RIFOXYB2_FULL_34_18]OGF29837.1 MAG: hypothetical protein A2500_01530 [Candidatus Falkowbacteria bacterium RIFOXYC12_FULL_34_55]OGF37048.1 MAG: hypothetical protein A2466_05675 [Candidatus Falkowbacteria bacterium RIFOXYC2_FULL_34_220]OGF39240.1 MAG: hypothetical protein A2515_00885 [Candidatus Falkowbacteria bacterium RIFOXYD12_FULL_34_57]OGF41345.1 MAG: hypothetical protein A2531_07095 [Candidatus Falkowbacteria bact